MPQGEYRDCSQEMQRTANALEQALKRRKYLEWVYCQLLGLSYNVQTVAVYWISADNFPKHMDWLQRPVSDFDSLGEIAPVTVFCFFESILFVTNQRSIPKKIANLLHHTGSEVYARSCSPRWVSLETTLGAMWKSAVSTTSFWALMRDVLQMVPFIRKENGLSLGLSAGLAFIFLWPNFVSQYVNFNDYPGQFSSIEWQHPKFLAAFGGIGYGVCNGALYFNTFDKVFKQWLGGNLSEFDSIPKKILFVLNALWSLQFTYQTSRHYTNLIVGSPPSENFYPDHLSLLGRLAAVWKVIVTSLSFISILNDLGSPITGYVLSLLFLLGNYLTQTNFYLEYPSRDDGEAAAGDGAIVKVADKLGAENKEFPIFKYFKEKAEKAAKNNEHLAEEPTPTTSCHLF